MNREDCDFEGRDGRVFECVRHALHSDSFKLRGFEHTLLRHTDRSVRDRVYGDDPLHTLSEDDYLNEPQIFPPDST